MKKTFIIIFLASFVLQSCNMDENSIRDINIESDSYSTITQNDDSSKTELTVAVSAMISPKKTFNIYKDLIDYVEKKSDVRIKFRQRKTYQEVNQLLLDNKLDFAFICTGAYHKIIDKNVELLAVPVVNGKPFYNAYLIVNEMSLIENLRDLKGKSFAFTDPLSNTGHDYIIKLLGTMNETPKTFFKRTIFTYAHDYSIQAVARNLIDGATVDGLVYDYFASKEPQKVKGVKVIKKSKDFGIPPIVIRSKINSKLKQKLKDVFFNMHKNAVGKRILEKIMIDKFQQGDIRNY